MTKTQTRFDVQQAITDRVVAGLEAGLSGESYRLPWTQSGGGVRPVNVASGRSYNGINVIALWFAAADRGYGSNVWGTYRQWAAVGAQVRKGETSSLSCFFKSYEGRPKGDDEEGSRVMVARATPVFNADQVDGWTRGEPAAVVGGAERDEAIERFVANTGARILVGGTRAMYVPSTDDVHMPPPSCFTGSQTRSATEAFYAVELHEVVHWTGHESRLHRDFSGRFGEEAYAMEELVAEMGAAFLCADLGLSSELRPDHVHYVASWLRVLKGDKKALFAAAAKAGQAFEFLMAKQPQAAADVGSAYDDEDEALPLAA